MLAAMTDDGHALLGAVAPRPDLAVPACPGWTASDLLAHTGGAHRWADHVLAQGPAAQERRLPAAPRQIEEWLRWYREGLDRLRESFDRLGPTEPVWTPTAGVATSAWWARKMAVETAIHRWDAQDAGCAADGSAPLELHSTVAAGGIDEFSSEFLPGLLAYQGDNGPRGLARLEAHDIRREWVLDLRPTDPVGGAKDAELTVVAGSASTLLLWMWNRHPDPFSVLSVTGPPDLLTDWSTLQI